MKVAVLDDWFGTIRTLPSFAKVAGHDVRVFTDHVDDVDLLASRLADIEALVLIRERTPITRELLEQLPHLRLISQRSVYPHIDVDACTDLGVVVSSDLNAVPSYATAELTWALALAVARQIPTQVESLRDGGWQSGVGTTLRGKTLGVIGYGRIGQLVAGFGDAFGMDVIVWGRERSLGAAAADGRAAVTKEEVFERSDVLTLHLRLAAATRGIVTHSDLARMKPTSILINTSRAGLIEPGALVEALQSGRPGGAGVDVFDHEPMRDLNHPLLHLPNVVATPHIGYVTHEEWEIHFDVIFDQVLAFAAGSPFNVVNPDALTSERNVS